MCIYIYLYISVGPADGWRLADRQRVHCEQTADGLADGQRTAGGRATDSGRTADGRRKDGGQTADGGTAAHGQRMPVVTQG